MSISQIKIWEIFHENAQSFGCFVNYAATALLQDVGKVRMRRETNRMSSREKSKDRKA